MTEVLPENYVFSIAVSPTFVHDGICFAAQQSGLYRSTDGGNIWQNAYKSLGQETAIPTHAVAFSPDYSLDRTVFTAVKGSILRSTDSGEHWLVSGLPSPPPVVSGLVVSPNYPLDGHAFCATVEDGVFITRDRGSRWATWNFGLLDLQILSLAVSPQYSQDEILFAGAESGVYRSKNGGRAWKAVPFPVDSAPVTSLVFSTDYGVDNAIFAGTAKGGLFKSNDQGNHWEVISQFEEGIDQILIGHDFQRKPENLLLEASRLHYSADAGQSWTKRRYTLPSGEKITCIAAAYGISADHPLLAGTVNHGVVII